MGVLLLPKVGIEINQAMKIDGYLLEKDTVINPDENYIISRDKQGNVVSYYKDDIWDFTSYCNKNVNSFYLHYRILLLNLLSIYIFY